MRSCPAKLVIEACLELFEHLRGELCAGLSTRLQIANAHCSTETIHRIQIEDTWDYLQTKVKAGGIMDVSERYPWTGQQQQHPRRDKRAGVLTGKAIRTPQGPGIWLVL